jgi:hypothetical protein
MLAGIMWIGFCWLRIGPVLGCCEHSNEPAVSLKGREFLDHVNDYFSFLRRALLHRVSRDYKLRIMQLCDPFLDIISNNTESPYVKFVRYILKVSHQHHVSNC